MDSGNSGSMQSSSGGGGDDQEFDSRGESISSFLNASHHFSSISAAPQPPFLPHQNPNFFVDPHQNLDQGGAHYTNDNDLIWSRGVRSDHNFSNLGSSLLPTSRPHHPIQNASFPGSSSADGHASRAPPPPQQQQQQTNATKNPKKRTRASRRAPTTVLTTDTTNFRQMVQEFTGIPAAPFSGSPYSRRLDLFSAASALRSASHLDNLGPLYPHPHRPAAHKIGLSPFSSSTSPSLLNPTMIDATVPTTTITNANNNNLGASTSNNPNSFQLSSGDHHHHYHLLSMNQHGIPQPTSLQLGANAPMNFANLSNFLNRDGASAAARGTDDDLSRWKSGETVRNNDGVQENLVEFDGNNINSGEAQNYNLNIAEKGMENVASSSAAEVGGFVASALLYAPKERSIPATIVGGVGLSTLNSYCSLQDFVS